MVGSSLTGPSGLVEGDVLIAVKGRPVNNIRDYKIVLADLIKRVQGGLCVEEMILPVVSGLC